MFAQQKLPLTDPDAMFTAGGAPEVERLSDDGAIERPGAGGTVRRVGVQDQDMEIAIADMPDDAGVQT